MRRSPIFALVALAIPALAAGQHGGGMPATGHASVSAPRVISTPTSQARPVPVQGAIAPRAMRVAPVTHRPGSGTVTHSHGHVSRMTPRGNNFTSDLNGVDFQDVPGLGFDYSHLAAVSGSRRHHANQFGAFSSGFGGFLLASPQVIVEEVQPSESQAAATEEDDADDAPQARVATRRSMSIRAATEQPAVQTPSSPENDPAEYVFVRRDGGLVFAVAYSWENGTLRYVTHDGMRRIIARETIDLTATQQFNEQRGLSFRAPA